MRNILQAKSQNNRPVPAHHISGEDSSLPPLFANNRIPSSICLLYHVVSRLRHVVGALPRLLRLVFYRHPPLHESLDWPMGMDAFFQLLGNLQSFNPSLS